jgi:cell division GTPase FtsZ
MHDDLLDEFIPPQAADKSGPQDNFEYPVAFKFAFIGVGQAGGRIAQAFNTKGYARVCAVNTTIQDLSELKLADKAKLDIGAARGAGKDPSVAAAIFEERRQDIYDMLRANWGEGVEYGFVCFSAGGGTGAGGFETTIAVVKEYLTSNSSAQVGVVVALPFDADDQQHARNAIATLTKLNALKLAGPIILIDNQRIRELYEPSVNQEKTLCNSSVVNMLHTFNRLAGAESLHESGTTYDRAEFARCLNSGIISFGADRVADYADPIAVTKVIRDRLKNNTLAAVDLTRGTVACVLYILAGDAQNTIKSSTLAAGIEMLSRMLQPGAIVFQGVYPQDGDKNLLQVMAMIGGLPWPAARINKLADKAGAARDSIAKTLGL